jgi:hypothetical protein
MKDVWICPNCRRRHQKTYTYGAVRGQSGDMVARELHHPDVTCDCGAAFPGYEIVGGAYDPPPITISPLVRCLIAAPFIGLFWGGVTYFFASATTSQIQAFQAD